MSWEQVARPHINDGHVLRFLDAFRLQCRCGMTLLIHREAGAPTPQPARWRRPDTPPATPEAIAWAKREALAAIEHARLRRTTATEETG